MHRLMSLAAAAALLALILASCRIVPPDPPVQEPQPPQPDELKVKIVGPSLVRTDGLGYGRFDAEVGGTMQEGDITYGWTHEGQGKVIGRKDRSYVLVQAIGGVGDRGDAVVRVTVQRGDYTAKASHTFRFWSSP